MGGGGKGSGNAGPSSPANGGETPYLTGKADQFVPTFDNQQRHYKEFRKRCEVYKKKMEIANRSQETIFNIVTLLTGKAWDLIDDIGMDVLQGEQGYNRVFERLDRGFKFDALTELPEDFEHYFVRLHRAPGETLQDYASNYARAERQLRVTHQVELPEKVRAWWFLRKSGISREQRQLILTNVGSENLTVEATQKAMYFILGQDSKMEHRPRGKADLYYQDEDAYYEDDAGWDNDFAEDTVYYNDVGGTDTEAPWPDQGQDYYDDSWTQEHDTEVFDVEEFDEIYASYADAKAKLNAMRTSRGFFPVVALVDKGAGRSLSPGKTGGKSRGGKPKGKKKGKDKQLPKGSTAKQRGQAAIGGRQVCLRCGQSGHWARNCPNGNSDPKKRRIGDGDGDEVLMVTEIYAMDQDDTNEEEPVNHATQDGGASSVLGSFHSVRRYLLYLLEQGYDLSTIETFFCAKGFRYGNSETERANTCILLPAVLGGKKVKVLTYLIDGTAPILFGRPLLKKLGIAVDYGNSTMRWPGCPWRRLPLGPKGEHLLNLVEDKALLFDTGEADAIYMPDDFETHIDYQNPLSLDAVFTLAEATEPHAEFVDNANGNNSGTTGHGAEEKDDDEPKATPQDSNTHPDREQPGTNEIYHNKPNQNDHEKPHEIYHNKPDQNDHEKPNEIYHNKPEQNDHEKPDEIYHNKLDTNDREKPDEIYHNKLGANMEGSPVKTLSRGKLHSLILTATEATKRQKRMLQQARGIGGDKKLIWEVFAGGGLVEKEATKHGAQVEVFTKKTGWDFTKGKHRRKFLRKLQDDLPDEVLLAPPSSLWTPDLEMDHAGNQKELFRKRREDHETILTFSALVYEMQRRGGRHAHLEHPRTSRAWLTKAFKQLVGYTTKVDQCQYGLGTPDTNGTWRAVQRTTCFMTTKETLHKKLGRTCPGKHQHVPDFEAKTQDTEKFPPRLAAKLAQLVAEENADDVFAETDDAAEEGAPTDPKETDPKNETIESSTTCTCPVLLRMLEEVQATDAVKEAAKNYICPLCYERRPPAGVPPASGLPARHFNDRVLADSAWVDTKDGRKCVLTLMCQATRYVAVRVLHSEKSTEFIKGIERSWVKHFGTPKFLRVDEAKGWNSQFVREWCADHNVTIEVAPAEAHSWLGACERRHQVVRRALELYMDEKGERTVKTLAEAAIYVPGQVNNLSFVKGFTPHQWVMGRSPMQATSLTADFFNPGHEPMDENTDFATLERRRFDARQAFLKADTDAKLRRAMNQNFRDSVDKTPAVGQRCWFWRVQGTGILQKNKWRGPARVVAHEHNDDGKLVVVWVTHGTHLIRCSPGQVRPLVEQAGSAPVADPAAALADLQDLKARSTTQFRDVYDGGDPFLEDMMDGAPPAEDLAEYSPSLPGDADAEDVSMEPVPGAVLLYQRQAEDRALPVRRRLASEEPDPEDPENAPPTRPASPKRARASAAVASSSPSPPQVEVPASHHDVPVPADDGDDDLEVEEVYIVDASSRDLPQGWLIVDGEMALDDAYMARTEAREKTMTVDERAQMMEAKKKELESFFKNQVWQFTTLDKSDEGRVVTARWAGARGFQDPDVLTLDKASPTASKQSKFLILGLTPILGWRLYGGDVRTAFLSGANFERRIIVRLPSDCGPLLGSNGTGGPTYMRCLYCFYGTNGDLLGAIILHVDDILAGGKAESKEFRDAVAYLRELFDFGKWVEMTGKQNMMYCGGLLETAGPNVILSFGDYVRKVAPVTVNNKGGRERPLTSWEVTKVRGLLGALQWPATQGLPPLSASVSLQAADVNQATTSTAAELNKTLRFAKSLAKETLTMTKVTSSLDNACFVCFSDAAFGVRSDHSSQGGYVILLTDKSVLKGETVEYNVLSWRSFKLTRVCRSSLAAEAQACATAVDELMMLKTMVSLMIDPMQDPKAVETARNTGASAVVIDAKALFDALQRKGFNSQQDKRSAIEILCIQQEIERLGAELRWVSSERMLADGLTKASSRQMMADMLRTRKICLKYDPNFVAAKKKTVEERAKAAAAAFGDRAYGSRAARQIATVLALSCVAGTEGATTDYNYMVDLGDFGMIALNLPGYYLFGVFLLVFFGYLFFNTVYKATTTSSTRRTASTTETEAQTDDDYHRLKAMWRRQGELIKELRREIEIKDLVQPEMYPLPLPLDQREGCKAESAADT
ncbi:spa [Symbiodinium microadriaticum]